MLDSRGSMFLVAGACIVISASLGVVFDFAKEWDTTNNAIQQLVLLVLMWRLQVTQDNDTQAIQLKLDEIVLAEPGARNELAGVEKKKD